MGDLGRADWQSVVNLDCLQSWMDGVGLSQGSIECPELLTGGTQNILLRFRRGERCFVLRRPSRNPRPDGDRTMRREALLLAALAHTNVPHPRLIAAATEPSDVTDTAFYLMEPIDGFNATVEMPRLHRSDPAVRRRMGMSLVEGLVTLSNVDPNAVGLTEFGRLDGFLERQAERWLAQFGSYTKFPAWNGHVDLQCVPAIAEWLEGNRPREFQPAILHGDFHIANVMYGWRTPEVAAIVDWEMATLGPALLDLGWLLATWPDPSDDNALPMVAPWSGFPTTDELISHYGRMSATSLGDLPWYRVLACYKFAIVLEGSHARASAGLIPRETGDDLHHRAINLSRRAVRLMQAA